MPRDWIDEKLMIGPTRGQRRNDWSVDQYRRALKICRLKSRGLTKMSALRLELWLSGAEMPFELLKKSFALEFTSDRKELLREIHSTYSITELGDLKSWRIKKIIEKFGEIDADIGSIMILAQEELFHVFSLLRHGTVRQEVKGALNNFVNSVFCKIPFLKSAISENVTRDLAEYFIECFSGFFGESDEVDNSIVQTISGESEESYEDARAHLFYLVSSLHILRNFLGCDVLNGNGELFSVVLAFLKFRQALKSPVWKRNIFLSLLQMQNSKHKHAFTSLIGSVGQSESGIFESIKH